MVTVEAMREYGYAADADWQAGTAQLCLDGAREYLTNAGVPTPTETAPSGLYDLAVLMLSMHWYDNRGVVTIGTVGEELQCGLQSIIWQLGGN